MILIKETLRGNGTVLYKLTSSSYNFKVDILMNSKQTLKELKKIYDDSFKTHLEST